MDCSHLNSTQARVQSIKADLQDLDLDHLESFLDGLADPEPPDYRKANGVIEPKLEEVKLKNDANIYEIGNVVFSTTDNSHKFCIFKVESGQVELYATDPLDKDHGNPLSNPILDSILIDLVDLWAAKFKAIKRRLTQVNDVRRYAHNGANQPEPRLSYSKNLSKLMDGQNGIDSANSSKARKRGSGEPVARHSANKRQRIGLASIPDSAKVESIARIPDQFMIDLFDNVAQKAFPGFDNLMMAAWNVVCVYEHVGTEFPEFHRSITDLKSVLHEFDATYRVERIKAKAEEKVSQELSAPNHSSNGPSESHTGPAPVRDRHGTLGTSERPREHLPAAFDNHRRKSHIVSTQSEPPPEYSTFDNVANSDSTPMSQNAATFCSREGRTEDVTTAEETRREALSARLRETQAEINQLHNGARSARFTPEEQRRGGMEPGFPKSKDRNGRPFENGRSEANTTRSTSGRLHSTKDPHASEVTDFHEDDAFEPPRGNDGRKHNQPAFLGNSKLGAPKTTGTVPEAPMPHTLKKEPNGGSRRLS